MGVPDRGFGKKQPGGWHYGILPYMGLENLYNMGLGQNYADAVHAAETAGQHLHLPHAPPGHRVSLRHAVNFNCSPSAAGDRAQRLRRNGGDGPSHGVGHSTWGWIVP